jgi:hypothetical protein
MNRTHSLVYAVLKGEQGEDVILDEDDGHERHTKE